MLLVMRTYGRIACLLLIVVCLGRPAHADLAAELGNRWNGKTITLRMPDRSNTLMFNSQGELVGKVSPGIWAADAMVEVRSVEVKNQQLLITGERVVVYFDRKQGTFAQALRKKDVTIHVELPGTSVTPEQFAPVLGRIFLTGSETIFDLAPSYWETCLKGEIIQRDGGWRCEGRDKNRIDPVTGISQEFSGPGVFKVGAQVSAPRPISTPDPDYTEAAKKMNIQGTTILWLVVDSSGAPRDIHIVSPIGFGLDDQAVRAVQGWKFKPATRNGVPVPVQINVEVNFRLY